MKNRLARVLVLVTGALALASVVGAVWLGARLMATRAHLSELRQAVQRCAPTWSDEEAR